VGLNGCTENDDRPIEVAPDLVELESPVKAGKKGD